MKVKLADATLLKDSMRAINSLLSEVKFVMDKEKLSLIAMDPANVAMVIFKLPSSSCTEYEVKGEEENFGVNLSNFTTILRRSGSKDSITLEIVNDQLAIMIGGLREYTLPIIELEVKDVKVPDLQFKASIETPLPFIIEALEDVQIIGESVSLTITEKKLVFLAQSDLSKAKITLPEDDATKIVTSFEEKETEVMSKYSLEYLNKMFPKVAKTVKIELGKDYPLRISLGADKYSLSFILAPRVDNN